MPFHHSMQAPMRTHGLPLVRILGLSILIASAPAWAAATQPAASPAPAPSPPAAVTPAPPTVTPPGTLDITSDTPGAAVQLDGMPAGVTPVELANVAPGTHEIRTETPGKPAQFHTVTVPKGGSAAIHVSDASGWTSATTPSAIGTASEKPGFKASLKALGRSIVVNTPWLAFLVVPAAGAAILALLTWSTPAADVPFQAQTGVAVSEPVWAGVRVVSLVAAVGLGALALVCVVAAVIFPFSRLVDVVDAMQARK